jgi:phenylalanyl-tRNA synthetase beta subunit
MEEEMRINMMIGEIINVNVNTTLTYNGMISNSIYSFELNVQYEPNRTIYITSNYSGVKKDSAVWLNEETSLVFRNFKLYPTGGNIEFDLIIT